MKFTEEQIDLIDKILSEESVDIEIILRVKEKISSQKSKKKEDTAKSTETCVASTKSGKRCSKKPSKGEQMCSVHLKKPSEPVSTKSVEPIPEDNMTKEEKKRQIELIFEENA